MNSVRDRCPILVCLLSYTSYQTSMFNLSFLEQATLPIFSVLTELTIVVLDYVLKIRTLVD